MRKVKILKPVDGYEVGDTPEVFGPKGREMIAGGYAEWADAESADKPAAKKAKKPRA